MGRRKGRGRTSDAVSMPSLRTVCSRTREAKGVRREVNAVATGVKEFW